MRYLLSKHMYYSAVLLAALLVGQGNYAKADQAMCPALAKIAQGSVEARNNGTSIQVLRDYVLAEFGQTQMYDGLMVIVEKSYYGFPNATPEQAYAETFAQCLASMR